MASRSKSAPKRQAIIVLGMHRSGTSALAGVLAYLGAKAPRTLLPEAKDNPKGFWESAELMKFHDQILASSGSRWNDWEEFNPDWIDSVVAEQFLELLPALIEKEFGDARLLLLKDPRICRFMPFWLRALEHLGITPKIVLPVRHPIEVAQSLGARNEFGPSRGLLLWLRHILDAEFATRKATRSFVRYEDVLCDWRGQVKKIAGELDIKWPRWSSAVEIEIDGHLNAELRHHAAGDKTLGASPELLGWADRSYQALGQLVTAPGSDQAQETLNGVKLSFDRAGGIFAAVVREDEIRLEAKVAKVRGELSKKLLESEEITKELESLKGGRSSDQALIAVHEETISQLTARVEEGAQTIARERAAAEGVLARLSTQEEAHEELLANYEDHKQLLHASTQELKELKVAFSECSQSLVVKEAELSKCKSRLESLQKSERSLLEFKAQADSLLVEIKDVATRLEADNKALSIRSQEDAKGLEERSKETARLTKLLIATERQAEARYLEREALAGREVMKRDVEIERLQQQLELMRHSWGWRLAGPFRRINRIVRGVASSESTPLDDVRLIEKSGWFDATWYLEQYPDVASSGIDPIVHYLEFGSGEGRDPGPKFSTDRYLRAYEDVAASGINPLLHFIQYGQDENRKPR